MYKTKIVVLWLRSGGILSALSNVVLPNAEPSE